MNFNEFSEKIKSEFKLKIGINLDEDLCQKFFDFMNYLLEKNQVMNLTAITEPNDVILKHFVDSSILLKFFPADKFDNLKFVDIGTGAGFPGIPLAIICKNANFVLTDSLGKRIKFLEEVVERLSLNNVQLVKNRAEDFCHNIKFREKFDVSLSRGVAKLSVLSEYSLPSLKTGGVMFAYKMADIDEELSDGKNAISKLGGMFHVKHPYFLLENEPERCIVEIRKTKPTPKQYPRKAGTPSKNPL